MNLAPHLFQEGTMRYRDRICGYDRVWVLAAEGMTPGKRLAWAASSSLVIQRCFSWIYYFWILLERPPSQVSLSIF